MQSLFHSCSTQRNAAVGTNGRKSFSNNLSSVRCLFLPMSSFSAIQNGFTVGSAYDVYFDDGTDVAVNDRLIWSGNTYLVKGVQRFTGLPTVSHIKVTAVTENAHV
jgi:hypothetical protein